LCARRDERGTQRKLRRLAAPTGTAASAHLRAGESAANGMDQILAFQSDMTEADPSGPAIISLPNP